MNTPALQQRLGNGRIDAVIVLTIVVAWLGFVALLTGGWRMIFWDTFRDMAWAENICAGQVWADPSLPNQSYWYAPGNPLLAAGLALLTRQPVVSIYGYSAFWWDALIPVAIYLLVRTVWDRLTALCALPAVFLGSFTWLTHCTATTPGFQGVVFELVGLLCWHRCVQATAGSTGLPRRRWIWAPVTGFVLSLSAWYHPLCAIVLAAAIGLHTALDMAVPGLGHAATRHRPSGHLALLGPMLVVALVAATLTAPLMMHFLPLQARNPALLHFFADELIDPRYYAQALAPLVVLGVLPGVWFIVRRTPQAAWVIAYLLVGLLGQAAGYLAQLRGWRMPYLLPHEFLWHAQLATGICAAVGVTGLARALAQGAHSAPGRRAAVGLAAVALLVVTTGPGARGLPQSGKYLRDLEPLLARTAEVRAWIRANTSLAATFLSSSDTTYEIVCGLTGRKGVVLPPGHTNPAVNPADRSRDSQTMLETTDPGTFRLLAERYGVTHLVLVFMTPAPVPEVRARYAPWSWLEPVFHSSDGTAIIYHVRAAERADEARGTAPRGSNEP